MKDVLRPVEIVRKSILDGREYSMIVVISDAQIAELESGGRRLIQEIVPHLSADEREFLMSGITPEKWRRVFGGGE